jgi:glycosyltransferase involved in cell wall biosynthesis
MLVRASTQAGIKVTVATTDDDGPGARQSVPLEQPIQGDDGATYHYFPRQLGFYTVSWPLRQWMRRSIREFDIVHIHSLFSFPSIVAARAARHAGVPYIVRPLGVLNRWGLENRRPFLKRVSLRFAELPIIEAASAMHYTSRREQREAETLDSQVGRTRAAIIPLPIDVPREVSDVALAEFKQRFPQMNSPQLVLFLSRLDRKKGVELLLEAFAGVKAQFPEALLVVAGGGDESYVQKLHALAGRLGIGSRVLWPGFLRGADKDGVLAAATVFVLPSYSENFGIAAAEALAAGVPVLLSDQVAVADDVSGANAGLVVRCDVSALTQGLRQLLSDANLRSTFVTRGRTLVEERYSTFAVGQQLKSLYESVMQHGTPL